MDSAGWMSSVNFHRRVADDVEREREAGKLLLEDALFALQQEIDLGALGLDFPIALRHQMDVIAADGAADIAQAPKDRFARAEYVANQLCAAI